LVGLVSSARGLGVEDVDRGGAAGAGVEVRGAGEGGGGREISRVVDSEEKRGGPARVS